MSAGRGPHSSLFFGEGGGFTSHSTQGKTKKVLIYSGFVSFLSFFFLKQVRPLGLNGCPRRQWRRLKSFQAGIFHGTDIKGFPPEAGKPEREGAGNEKDERSRKLKTKGLPATSGRGVKGADFKLPTGLTSQPG